MKTAKVTRVEFKREWTGQNGVVYYHDIELDNGDKGSIGCKSKLPDSIAEGKELSYEITQDGEYNGQPRFKIKAVSAKPFSSGGYGGKRDPETDIRIARQSSLKIASEVILAAGGHNSTGEIIADIIDAADILTAYVMNGKK